MKTLNFRAPATSLSAIDMITSAVTTLGRQAASRLIRRGELKVSGKAVTDPGRRVEPGVSCRLEVSYLPPSEQPPLLVAQGDDWIVVDKPAGCPCHAPETGLVDALDGVARLLGEPRDRLWPVHRLDSDTSGAWVIARSKTMAKLLGDAFESRQVSKTYQAIVPALPWRRGQLTAKVDGRKALTAFEVVNRAHDWSRVELQPSTGRQHQLRQHMAGLGAPIVGDNLYGGVAIGGGLRLRATHLSIPSVGLDVRLDLPPKFEPDCTLFADFVKPPVFRVSRATVSAMNGGHPWVLTDTETDDAGRFRPGTMVSVRDPANRSGGLALIEGTGRVAARQLVGWSEPPTLESLVETALAKRDSLFSQLDTTNAFRLIHGEADAMPGLHVDLLGSCLRVIVRSLAAQPWRPALADVLGNALKRRGLPVEAVVEVVQLRPIPVGSVEAVRLLAGELPGKRLVVRERGLEFWVDPGLSRPEVAVPGIGLFMDQRENRDLVCRNARGRWLNLFAHTGAFSVALLAAGADHVTSVDLSNPYLRWLDDNLDLNGIQRNAHRSVKSDARKFLEKAAKDVLFDGIILDPPTAARAGRRFWSVKQGAGQLIDLCFRHLTPDGQLLLTRNDYRSRGTLRTLVHEVAAQSRRRISSVAEASPSLDFPRLEGFPEGDAFTGLHLRLK